MAMDFKKILIIVTLLLTIVSCQTNVPSGKEAVQPTIETPKPIATAKTLDFSKVLELEKSYQIVIRK